MFGPWGHTGHTFGSADLDFEGRPTPVPRAKDPAEALECPKSGCQRPKPAENATGGLTCWWCGHTGSWHEFPKRRVYEDGGK